MYKLYGVMIFKASLTTKISFLRKKKGHYETESYEFSYQHWKRLESLLSNFESKIHAHDDTLSVVYHIRKLD
jgi:hypothetical protein